MIYKGQELEEYDGKTNSLLQDLTGKTIGHWYVICRAKVNKNYRPSYWCECLLCNKIKTVESGSLARNHTTRCRTCRFKKEKIGEISVTWWNGIIKQTKKRTKDLTFNITIEYAWKLFLKQNRKCALSGLEIGFDKECKIYKTTGNYYWKHSASLDRIDSNKGYIKGNVQWVHKDINWMKNDLEQSYFIDLCKAVTTARNNDIEYN